MLQHVTTSVTHTVTSSIGHGRDWVEVTLLALPAVSSLIISSFALWTSYNQSIRTSKLTERQLELSAAKLRLDMFEERYRAWAKFDTIAAHFAAGIDDVVMPKLVGLITARRRLTFLFGDDVSSIAHEITKALLSLFRDEGRLRKHRSGISVMTASIFEKVDNRKDSNLDLIDDARGRLEVAVKSYLRLDEIK